VLREFFLQLAVSTSLVGAMKSGAGPPRYGANRLSAAAIGSISGIGRVYRDEVVGGAEAAVGSGTGLKVFLRAAVMPGINMRTVHDPHVGAAAATERTRPNTGRHGSKNLERRVLGHPPRRSRNQSPLALGQPFIN
jgi:hypothetical protein